MGPTEFALKYSINFMPDLRLMIAGRIPRLACRAPGAGLGQPAGIRHCTVRPGKLDTDSVIAIGSHRLIRQANDQSGLRDTRIAGVIC